MSTHEAQERAAKLGLSAWTVEVIVVGREAAEPADHKYVGFAGIDFPIAEGETWEKALSDVTRIIFAA